MSLTAHALAYQPGSPAPRVAGLPIAVLARAAELSHVSDRLNPEVDPRWNGTRGDRQRGPFYAFRMPAPYNNDDLAAALLRASARAGYQVVAATVYETVAFAARGIANDKSASDESDEIGWDSQELVIAHGSTYTDPCGDRPYKALLWRRYPPHGPTRLDVRPAPADASAVWNPAALVLCVGINVPQSVAHLQLVGGQDSAA